MRYRVLYPSYQSKTSRNDYWREGKVVYIHPQRRFIVLEFQGKLGPFREAFYPDELLEV